MVIATPSGKPCARGCRAQTCPRRKRAGTARCETEAAKGSARPVTAVGEQDGETELCSCELCKGRGSGALAQCFRKTTAPVARSRLRPRIRAWVSSFSSTRDRRLIFQPQHQDHAA